MTRRILIPVLILAAVSCGRLEPSRSDEDGKITVFMETKASFLPPSGEISSMILVAGSSDFAGMASNGLADPYYSCVIPDLNQWDGHLYNTHKPYPGDDSRVYIFGYAPENGLTTTDSWKTLLPAYPGSVYDNSLWGEILLASPVSGKLSLPVADPLEYRHPVARFRFLAFKESGMVNYHVKNVRLTAGAELAPYSLVWNNGMWSPRSNANYSFGFTFKDSNETTILGLGEANALEMSPYYILPQESNTFGPFSIEATYYIEGDPSSERTYTKPGVYFQITEDLQRNPVSRINPGEDYAVLIRFNQDSFSISGVRLDDWEDGGNIIIPMINETTIF